MILTDQQYNTIEQDLKLGILNFTDIAKKLNISRPTVRAHAKRIGLHTGNKIRLKSYTLNVNYFDNIDTQEKAYILGLLYADGCNTRRGLQIALVEEDKEVIEFVKVQLGASNNLKFIPAAKPTWKNKWELSISSIELSKNLSKVGCIPAKSSILKFPDFINSNLIHHFVRGYFDGDGSIWLHKGGWHSSFTSASEDFILSLQDLLTKQGIYTKLYKTGVKKTCFQILLGRKYEIEKLMLYLFNGSTFSMKRKRLKMEMFLTNCKSSK
jgi:hypothetical protein